MEFDLRQAGLVLVLAVGAVGLLVAGGVAGLPSTADDPTGEEVLNESAERYADAESLVATATVTVSNGTATETATVDVAAADPNMTRVVVTRGNDTYRAGYNGSVVWAVGGNRSFAREVPANGTTWAGNGTAEWAKNGTSAVPGNGTTEWANRTTDPVPDRNVTATLVGTETVDGTEAYVVEVAPANESRAYNATLWVATDDYRVVRAVTTDGTNRTTVDVQSTQFNVSIDDSEFQPPTDRVAVTTVDRYDDFAAAQNATDRALRPYDNGTLRSVQVVTRANSTVVAQTYATDAGNATFVSATGAAGYLDRVENGTTVTVDGAEARVVERDGRAIVAWQDGDVTRAVVVEADADTAVALARAW